MMAEGHLAVAGGSAVHPAMYILKSAGSRATTTLYLPTWLRHAASLSLSLSVVF